ncbi:MAG: hypothetical protein KGR17_07580 [Acidobacteria bacterium]|nr:hypothetical protein [Acidobacteriota bacterium]
MGNLLFLIVPAVLAAVAVTFVWLRNRPETSPTAGIDRFSDQMAALAPERVEDRAGVTVLTPDDGPLDDATVEGVVSIDDSTANDTTGGDRDETGGDRDEAG